MPYATLAAMTFPAILYSTSNVWAATAGFLAALVLAYRGKSLLTVAGSACVVVFILELILYQLSLNNTQNGKYGLYCENYTFYENIFHIRNVCDILYANQVKY